jgi:predicted PurR-regulated permease PerM
LAVASAFVHWVAFQSLGTAAPVALALWVGLISQFIPVVGTYIAGVLPVLITFIDSPWKALVVVIVVILYQQLENFLISPRITARTLEIHPAISFGAILGLPVAAMAVALASASGERHELIENELVEVQEKSKQRIRRRGRRK